MGEPVLNDAQVSFPEVLKPIQNFETLYQGQAGDRIIAFPGGVDPQSAIGTTGFAPNLQRGISVAFGSRLFAWIPLLASEDGALLYRFRFVWRLRNVIDYRSTRRPFHLPDQRPGVPDTLSGSPVPRFVVIGGSQVIMYEHAEPVNPFDPGVVTLRNQWFIPQGGLLDGSAPFDETGQTTIISQGVFDPATNFRAPLPLWNVFRVDAEGDELIILCQHADTTLAWDFAGRDAQFADFFGTGGGTHAPVPNLGLLIFQGTNP